MQLPQINDQHRYAQEWLIRKKSGDRLLGYLLNKRKTLQILEVGCGNGWLAAKLSSVPSALITAIDINIEELNQAKRVFSSVDNLEFLHCSLQDALLQHRQFDIIIFAASIQYFNSVSDVLKNALSYLKPGGEIHIIDSRFYKRDEVDMARQRSIDYFRDIGFPGMINQYFHHSLEELGPFNHRILSNPNSILNRIKQNKDPFYWICVKANA